MRCAGTGCVPQFYALECKRPRHSASSVENPGQVGPRSSPPNRDVTRSPRCASQVVRSGAAPWRPAALSPSPAPWGGGGRGCPMTQRSAKKRIVICFHRNHLALEAPPCAAVAGKRFQQRAPRRRCDCSQGSRARPRPGPRLRDNGPRRVRHWRRAHHGFGASSTPPSGPVPPLLPSAMADTIPARSGCPVGRPHAAKYCARLMRLWPRFFPGAGITRPVEFPLGPEKRRTAAAPRVPTFSA